MKTCAGTDAHWISAKNNFPTSSTCAAGRRGHLECWCSCCWLRHWQGCAHISLTSCVWEQQRGIPEPLASGPVCLLDKNQIWEGINLSFFIAESLLLHIPLPTHPLLGSLFQALSSREKECVECLYKHSEVLRARGAADADSPRWAGWDLAIHVIDYGWSISLQLWLCHREILALWWGWSHGLHLMLCKAQRVSLFYFILAYSSSSSRRTFCFSPTALSGYKKLVAWLPWSQRCSGLQ